MEQIITIISHFIRLDHVHRYMKYFLALFIILSVSSADFVDDPIEGFVEGKRYFFFPGDGDGILHLVDSQALGDLKFITAWAGNPNNNVYWLYTRANPNIAEIMIRGDQASFYNYSNFDQNKDTVFLAHGWKGNGNNEMNKLLTKAFLDNKDVNVIVLDWSHLAKRNYVTAKTCTAAVGRALGEFITWLTTMGLLYEKVHLVGFSLGAHLVGNAGRATGGRVARITALDPDDPLWHFDSDRIQPSDAQYVEVIHTNAAIYGYNELCGDADFYPNGGSTMPGCWVNACSHNKAYKYLAYSLRYNHLYANECETLDDAIWDRCSGDLNLMGNSNLNKSRHGIFRINTARMITVAANYSLDILKYATDNDSDYELN